MNMSWRDNPVTDKQYDFIGAICENLGVVFSGKTKGEASDFITKHKGMFECLKEENKLQNELDGLVQASMNGG